jgi:uncharacterized protein YecE (DUF72 family)
MGALAMTLRVHVGTSGFSYKEWKGSFYPANIKPAEMLRFYGERFRAVEINNTFYRMPQAATLAPWTEQVGADFRFVLKAPQRITHQKRLSGIEDDVSYFLAAAAALGDRLGPVLFQLPPYLKKDVSRLDALLRLVPAGQRAALEFRHESWFADDVYESLQRAGAALCLADTDEAPLETLRPTAPWGYLRLRRTEYDEAALGRWAERVRAQSWEEAFVFFKHEDEGKGPLFAQAFLAQLAHR